MIIIRTIWHILKRIISVLANAAFWLGVCAFFYVSMCMGMTEEAANARTNETPRPYVEPKAMEAPVRGDAAGYFPYPGAYLTEQAGVLESEMASDVQVSGRKCRVLERIYTDAQGRRVSVRSATPAAYLSTYADCEFSQEGYAMPDGLSAQYIFSSQRDCLLMRSGEVVYAVETQDGKEALLRAAANLAFE